MKLTNGNLSQGSKHDDVKEQLHPELSALGFDIGPAEVDEGFFGDTTLPAVMDFQRDQDLAVTGVVNKKTAAALDAEVKASQRLRRTVQGRVRTKNDQPVPDVSVLAYRAGLKEDELLGQANTNQRGEYRIAYRSVPPSSSTRSGIALLLRVVNPLGVLLASSDTRFNAAGNETVDIVVTSGENVRLSEYENLLAALAPIVEDTPLARLSGEQVAHLAGSTGESLETIRALVEATQSAEDTGLLSPAVFFAFARAGFPLDLDNLLDRNPKELVGALKTAIDEGIVPARLGGNMDDILVRLSELTVGAGLLITHTAGGRLIDRATGKPLAGFSVSVTLPGEQDSIHDVATTREDGAFSFAYVTPRRDGGQGHRLVFRVAAPDGDPLPDAFEHTVTAAGGKFDVPVPAPETPRPITLTALAHQLDLNLPQGLLTTLSSRGIENLDGLREAGGLEALLDGPLEDDQAIKLEAHARLGILPTSLTQNAALIDAGYTSPRAIAEANRVDLVNRVGPALGDLDAVTVHEQGRAAAYLLDGYVVDAVADDWVLAPDEGANDPGLDLDSEITDVFPPACQCSDCLSAVSPAAYLADLLDYVSNHLKSVPAGANDGPPVSLGDLAGRFHQPFGELTASCDEVDRIVPQIRICIEVLRRFLEQGGAPAPGSTEAATFELAQKRYLEQAYQSILDGLGASYEELRDSRGADEATQEALAIRLGLDPQLLNRLDELFLAPAELDEQALEQLFGLPDTGAPPVPADTRPDFPTWQLEQLRKGWRREDAGAGRPIIDPDLIGPGYLKSLSANDGVFDLRQARAGEIRLKLEQLGAIRAAAAGNQDWLNTAFQDTLGVTAQELATLETRRNRGENISRDLENLALTNGAFDYLLRVRNLAEQDQPILESEAGDVINILVQVHKHRDLYDAWRREEVDRGVILGPDHFVIPGSPTRFPLPESRLLPNFRASQVELNQWRHTLQARIEQVEALTETLKLAVEAAEETALPGLRDALIAAGGRNAQQLTDDLLIDCRMDGCKKTTRIAQAVETAQVMLWSVRTAQLNDSHPDLELADENFDEAWKWLGSYETWRAAIFAFLYPENILQPALRPNQTQVFREIVEQTRSNRRLTPADAGRLAGDYAAYVADLAGLKMGASCYATAKVFEDRPYRGTIAVTRDYFYLFAYAETSRKVYWSTRDPQDESGFAHSYWREVPGLEDISAIIGAQVFRISPTRRFIYLFVKANNYEGQHLVYTRLNLEQVPFQWDEEPAKLSTPGDAVSFEATIVQRHNVEKAPELGLETPAKNTRKSIYRGRLVGEEFAGPQDVIVWTPLETDAFKNLLSIVGWGDDGVLVFSTFVPNPNVTPRVTVRYYPKFGGGVLHRSATLPGSSRFDSWQGAFTWPGEDNLAYAFWRVDGASRYVPLWGKGEPFFPDRHYSAAFADNLDYFAPHNVSDPASSNRLTLAFQRVGASGGPFHGAFERKPKPGIAYSTQPAASREDPEGSGGLTVMAMRLDNGRFDSRIGGDLIGVFDPLPADDTPPPELIKLQAAEAVRLAPRIDEPLDIVAPLPENEQSLRRVIMASAFQDNLNGPRSNLVYLEEAHNFLPLHLALQLQRSHHFVEALDWFRTVYDYSLAPEKRKIYYGLILEESLDQGYERAQDWLLDPLQPHNIAGQRRNAQTRFTVLSIVKCLLDYADREFGRDTAESVARARLLYMTVLELLNPPDSKPGDCRAIIIGLDTILASDPDDDFDNWRPVWDRQKEMLAGIRDPGRLSDVAGDLGAIWAGNDSVPSRLARIEARVAHALASGPGPVTLAVVIEEKKKRMARAYALLQKRAGVPVSVAGGINAVGRDLRRVVADVAGVGPGNLGGADLSWLGEKALLAETNAELLPNAAAASSRILDETHSRHSATWEELAKVAPLHLVKTDRRIRLSFAPGPNYHFCVPANPLLDALRRHAGLNLYKVRSCRDIAGEVRDLEPYATPIETGSGLPAFGDGGRLPVRRGGKFMPTVYRYVTLIERAKQLVSHAQQLEAALLSALEKYDGESYRLLQARMDIRLNRAGLRLQQLRLQTARLNGRLAQLQHQRAKTQEAYYQQLLREGNSTFEISSLAAGWLSVAVNPSSLGSFLGNMGSFERRRQEWGQQLSLARQDSRIGLFQLIAAGNEQRVAGQEVNIAELNLNHAEVTADFLINKFTSAQLYEWMSEVLERVYRFFLQQATAVARLAENQLAFERQETPPPFIQSDYWDAPMGMGTGDAPDRRGLTGSARLLQDIFQLDQYAFGTDRRKLQLTKTLSLALLSPGEFQRFRSSGVLPFATSMSLFDRDFPGHYLRLIKGVRVSVVALIPPNEGIKAVLSNTGLSRVMADAGIGQVFETMDVRRLPESVALTSPREATGLFELSSQSPEKLLPFEGLGVDTTWEFQLPKASNHFDYGTIADVLITIEYTALNSNDYRRQVIQQLNRTFSADRPFSFRREFADEWYDLNHPGLVEAPSLPMVVAFDTRRGDFPPNLDQLEIQHVVLYFSRKDGSLFEVTANLAFTSTDGNSAGGIATSIEGIISTRRGNASAWNGMPGKPPVGTWTLDLTANLPDGRPVEVAIKEEEIEDILFVITYRGRTREWPA